MSFHAIPAINPQHRCIVEWDNPLSTFFIQVVDRVREEAGDDDCYALLAGMEVAQIPTVEALREELAGWAMLPKEIAVTLQREQREAEAPTPLQRRMRTVMEEMR